MLILSMNSGHNGGTTAIEDGRLLWSREAEKNSNWRFSGLTPQGLISALEDFHRTPDVVALGGWRKSRALRSRSVGAGYEGWDARASETTLFGRRVQLYNSTHERSHVFAALGLAEARFPALCLVWEGSIGCFYKFDDASLTPQRVEVLRAPGERYSALFAIADERVGDHETQERLSSSGKMMALAAYGDRYEATRSSIQTIEQLLDPELATPIDKSAFRSSDLYNCGVTSKTFENAAAYISHEIFSVFMTAAHSNFAEGLPLYVGGGCALNCEWNARFRASGYFSDVQVAPCPNDSGSSLGTALDAQHHFTGSLDLKWSVYSGGEFVANEEPATRGWRLLGDHNALLAPLHAGEVVAWAEGRWELGPRALGGRSLLAGAHLLSSREKLNEIKRRESYRPVAPMCREEDVAELFVDGFADPYMLYFQQVRERSRLPATTHVDGSARVQTVTKTSRPRLHDLIGALSGIGVPALCNTSLNYPSLGFINNTRDLLDFCLERGVRYCYIDGASWTNASPT